MECPHCKALRESGEMAKLEAIYLNLCAAIMALEWLSRKGNKGTTWMIDALTVAMSTANENLLSLGVDIPAFDGESSK